MRIALFYDIAYTTKSLVKYRRHEGMETNRFMQIEGLQQAYQAKMTVLTKHPSRINHVTEINKNVIDYYERKAAQSATYHISRGDYGRAKPLHLVCF